MDKDLFEGIEVERFKHVDPSPEYTDSVISFVDELRRQNGRLFDDTNTTMSWLREIESELSRNKEHSRKFEGVKLLVRANDDEVVGVSCIHERLDEETLRSFGGNISHVIRPSQRRKGYNKINLYLALKECKCRGMKYVVMTVDKENVAGVRSIKAMGGSFMRDLAMTDEESFRSEEYMVRVDPAIEMYKDVFEHLIVE